MNKRCNINIEVIKENTIYKDNFIILYKCRPKILKATIKSSSNKYGVFYLYLMFNDIILFYKKDIASSDHHILICFHIYKIKNNILKL